MARAAPRRGCGASSPHPLLTRSLARITLAPPPPRPTQAAALRNRGVDARNLSGGILGWTQKGYDLQTPQGDPTHRVHVFSSEWELQADDYEPVAFARPGLTIVRSMLPTWMGGIS